MFAMLTKYSFSIKSIYNQNFNGDKINEITLLEA